MKVENVPINKIRPYERNPRINDAAVDKVAESIKRFSFQQPIVCDRDGVIIVGHTRLKAAQKLGLDTVPVVYADLSEEEAKAYRLADNKTGEFAEWDSELLDLELGDIELDMEPFGFDTGAEEYPDDSELDAETEPDEKTVARLVFQNYKSYSQHEREIKEFAGRIGASVTVGK